MQWLPVIREHSIIQCLLSTAATLMQANSCCFSSDNCLVTLWHCWLGVRKSTRPARNWVAWLSVWSAVYMICMWSSCWHCHPIISCFIKIQIDLTFLVLAYPGCPEKTRLNGCMSVCGVCLSVCLWSIECVSSMRHTAGFVLVLDGSPLLHSVQFGTKYYITQRLFVHIPKGV